MFQKEKITNMLKMSSSDLLFNYSEVLAMMRGIEAATYRVGWNKHDIRWNIIKCLPDNFRVECVPHEWLGLDEPSWCIHKHIINGEFTSFHNLLKSLNTELKDVRESLLSFYLQVVSICCGKLKNNFYCKAGFNVFENTEPQRMAYFYVKNTTKDLKNKINLHGHNTSQLLLNGALVFDTRSNKLSIHS